MNVQKKIAVVLIVIGAIGLAYGGFNYTSDAHHVDIGSMHMSVSEHERVNIPIWAGVTFILVGGLLMVTHRKW